MDVVKVMALTRLKKKYVSLVYLEQMRMQCE